MATTNGNGGNGESVNQPTEAAAKVTKGRTKPVKEPASYRTTRAKDDFANEDIITLGKAPVAGTTLLPRWKLLKSGMTVAGALLKLRGEDTAKPLFRARRKSLRMMIEGGYVTLTGARAAQNGRTGGGRTSTTPTGGRKYKHENTQEKTDDT